MNEARFFRIIYILVDTWQLPADGDHLSCRHHSHPAELYEAANHRRCQPHQQIFYVTIPSIMPTIM
jgi:putative aldouronate transport system permease protein